MDDAVEAELSPESLEKFFAIECANSPSPAPRPVTQLAATRVLSPFAKAMAKWMEKLHMRAREHAEAAAAQYSGSVDTGTDGYEAFAAVGNDATAISGVGEPIEARKLYYEPDLESEQQRPEARRPGELGMRGRRAEVVADDAGNAQPSRFTSAKLDAHAIPGLDGKGMTSYFDDENPIATGKSHRVLDAGPKQRNKRKRVSTDQSEQDPVERATSYSASVPRQRAQAPSPSTPIQRQNEQRPARRERPSVDAIPNEQPTAHYAPIQRQNRQPLDRREPPAREAMVGAIQNERDTYEATVSDRQGKAKIEDMRRLHAKDSRPTAWANPHSSDSAKKIQDKNSRTQRLESLLATSSNRVAPLFRAAYKHLDNLTQELKDGELEACAREDKVQRMLYRAKKVRREAAEWRAKGGEMIEERRERLGEEELMGVEGWEEVLEPFRF